MCLWIRAEMTSCQAKFGVWIFFLTIFGQYKGIDIISFKKVIHDDSNKWTKLWKYAFLNSDPIRVLKAKMRLFVRYDDLTNIRLKMPTFIVSKIGNLLNDLPICNFSSFFSESYGLKCFAENSNRPLSIRKCAFFAFGNPQVEYF